MQPLSLLALALMLGVGLSLGAMGGGGSILVLPILVYLAGLPAAKAVAMSLAVVAVTSLLGAALQARQGHVHWRAVAYFGAPGAAASVAASQATDLVSDRILMGIFACVAAAAGVAMWRGRGERPASENCNALQCAVAGGATGALTGFLGVGGGFLIVPALVLLSGLSTKSAVGTSLWVISVNAFAGLGAHARHTSLDWGFTAALAGVSVAGMVGGVYLATRVTGPGLKKAFAVVVVTAALAVGTLSATGISMG